MLPCLSLLCFTVFGPPGVALGGTDSMVSSAQGTSVQAYGRANPQCLAWTDGCVTCKAAAGSAQCSTPGIACTPKPTSCQQTRP